MTELLRCSVVINTYNRASCLRRLLAALHRLSYDHFEVVVVNGPSTDATAAFLEQYAGRIKVVECPEANLSVSRNLGIAAAAGDVVVFIDDDAVPADREWLSKMARAFQEETDAETGAAGGAVLHRDTPYYEFRGGATSDYGLQVFRQEEMTQQLLDGKCWVRGIAGGNSAFRRSALEQIQGFDHNIAYYLDETDVCLRLAREGYNIAYLDDCPVRHYPVRAESSGTSVLGNRRLITRSDTYYCLKNGADWSLKRLLKTLWLAPQKHFVREVPELWKTGHIPTGHLLRFFCEWISGLLSGLRLGLLAERRTRLASGPPPDFLPFAKRVPKKKLRVCLLSESVPPDPRIGGVARYTYDLATGLHELGHEVHLICKSEQSIRRDNLEFTIHGIAASEYAQQLLFSNSPVLNKNVVYALAVAHKLVGLARQGTELDLVHASNWNLEGLALPMMRVYPFVLMLVSPLAEVIEAEKWQYTHDLRTCVALDCWQIEHSDSVCCPSWRMLQSYEEKMGLDTNALASLHRVRLGIVPATGEQALERSGDPKRLLFVGRVERRKGAHILLEVLPQLLSSHPDWECHLVGDDRIQDQSGDTIKQRFLAKHKGSAWLSRVHFHGVVSDEELVQFYRTSDLFVAPSLYESFGLIYLEAMQHGKAVVGCKVGGIPDVVDDGVDGVLVEPGDSASLAEAVDRLMEDAGLREALGRAGKTKVHRSMNYLTMARAFEAVYLDAIARVGRERRERLARLHSTEIPIFDPERVARIGEWRIRDAVTGQTYLFADAQDASLSFSGPSGSVLNISALRHGWSGVLAVQIQSAPPVYLDLFSCRFLSDHTFELGMPGSPKAHTSVRLTVHRERNPESRGNEVWLKAVFCTRSLPQRHSLGTSGDG